MTEKRCLQVKTNLAELHQILNWFEQQKLDTIPQLVWLQCQTALAEGFTNAVRHAHSMKSAETPIDIELIFLEQYLEMRIWDYGAPFNLEAMLQTIPEQVSQHATGGRGLRFISRVADRFHYIREGDRNCWLFVKCYDEACSV